MDRILCRENGFFDDMGRQRIFHGVNLVYKAKGIGPWDQTDYRYLASQGYNIVRFGLLWASIEPEPWRYNDKYLDWVRFQMDLCAQYGLYVVLDMHQDLFSQAYGDGAPEWATLSKGEDYSPTDPWSEAYLTSRGVMNACDSFWADECAPDGSRLQSHFAKMWGYTAKRLCGHPALLGYDLYNEPFPGASGQAIVADLLGRVGKTLSISQPERLLEDEAQWNWALEQLNENDRYWSVMKEPSAAMERFEREQLRRLYERTAVEIRRWDRTGILFLEHCYFGNLGLPTGMMPLEEGQQAYAPHGYDLTVDTPMAPYAGLERLQAIFRLQQASARRIGMPVLMGEWGALYQHQEGLAMLQEQLAIFDQYQWSHTYWSYEPGYRESVVEKALRRPYPMAIGGCLEHFSYDPHRRRFCMNWQSGPGETIIFLPDKPEEITGFAQEARRLVEINGGYRLILPAQAYGKKLALQVGW